MAIVTSKGQVSGGALVGPGSYLTYSSPSVKLTEQADGLLKFQAHNLYLNSEAPANQSITVISGATYSITITGSVSLVASGAATGTWTEGTTDFTAATGTLTLGSTTGSGTVHLRRTPSQPDYIRTTTAAAYDLPYVYSGGVRQGIMVEPAATNLALQSDDISNAAWTKTNGTVISGAFVTTTAVALGSSSVFQSFSKAASATQYTFTADIEGQGLDRVTFRAQDSAGTVNSSTVIVSVSDGSTVSQTNAGSFSGASASARLVRAGVWRVSLTFTSSADTFLRVIIFPNDSVLTTGNGVAGIKINLIQLETGTVATSPIITYGAAVARAADNPLALLNLFPSIGTAYTIYAKYKPQSASVATTAIRLDDTTTNELVSLENNASGAGLATVIDGGVSQASITSGTITASAFHRVAASVEANNVRLVVNGGAQVQDTSVTLPTLTRLVLGGAGGMELQQLAILPGARTEAQLQALGA